MGGGGGTEKPADVDYDHLAELQREAGDRQLRNNRPDINTDFYSQQWTTNPDGTMSQNSHLTGNVGQGFQNATATLANQGALDLGQYKNVMTGDSARDQAITGAYSQAMARLGPQQQQASQDLETQLANQGLQPGSEAYERARQRLGFQQTDATQSALNSAIQQGTAAGSQVFQNNLEGNQFNANLDQTQHNQAYQDLNAYTGFLAPQGFQADNATASQSNAAAGTIQSGQQQQFDQYMATKPAGFGEILGSVAGIAQGVGGMMMSDARVKEDIRPVGADALPGVPLVTFRYREGLGLPRGVFVGVLAQDLAQVAPAFVHRHADGLMEVDYSFMERN